MIDIKRMTPKKWNPIRQDLEKRLNEHWRFTRISRVDRNKISIEGGRIPIGFNIETEEMYVHSRCSRYAGASVYISHLNEIQDILIEWNREFLKEN